MVLDTPSCGRPMSSEKDDNNGEEEDGSDEEDDEVGMHFDAGKILHCLSSS